ncbi:hypothetical protein EZY14_018140 [Kordia sp. TARA_039_SRF]|nr:hypothetical protein EZY14_018140 [Kordia sp. TARA_039_SRF]
MIRNVYNDLNKNKEIENAILDLYLQKLEEKEKDRKIRDKLLGINNNTKTKNYIAKYAKKNVVDA